MKYKQLAQSLRGFDIKWQNNGIFQNTEIYLVQKFLRKGFVVLLEL